MAVSIKRIVSAQLHIFRLHHSRSVSIADVRCRPHCRECGGEEATEAHQIVFVRAGVFVRRHGRRELVADANHVLFFNRHQPYRVSHPVGDGDDCTVFTFSPELLCEAAGAFSTRVSERNPFGCEQMLSGQDVFLLHQRIRQFLLRGERDTLTVEEATLNLLGGVASGACRECGFQGRSCRPATAEAHRRHTESARLFLAARLAEDLTLDDIAQAVHCSPFHLARIFRRGTGLSMHQYRDRLRLRTALERIGEGANDLTRLALDLGYSSHSHFADVFRRAFGLSPSSCRQLTSSSLREMSRNLKVAT